MSAGARQAVRMHCLGCHEDYYDFGEWIEHRETAAHGDQGVAVK